MVREGTIEEVAKLMLAVPEFDDPYPIDEFSKRLTGHPSLILVEEDRGILRGFKCGYERTKNNGSFYSWMGAVLPEYRRSNIALVLLKEMENWCLQNGYRQLTFKTLNQHKAMLIFAIKNGFEITEIENANGHTSKIWLSKKLG